MATEGSVADDVGAPESWEVADLDESMSRLLLSTSNNDKDKDCTKSTHDQLADASVAVGCGVYKKVDDDVINQVDQFLREALQNPRERLSGKCTFIWDCFGDEKYCNWFGNRMLYDYVILSLHRYAMSADGALLQWIECTLIIINATFYS